MQQQRIQRRPRATRRTDTEPTDTEPTDATPRRPRHATRATRHADDTLRAIDRALRD